MAASKNNSTGQTEAKLYANHRAIFSLCIPGHHQPTRRATHRGWQQPQPAGFREQSLVWEAKHWLSNRAAASQEFHGLGDVRPISGHPGAAEGMWGRMGRGCRAEGSCQLPAGLAGWRKAPQGHLLPSPGTLGFTGLETWASLRK